MKQILPALFLFLLYLAFPQPILATIDLSLISISPKDDYFELTAKVTGMSSSSGTFVQGMFTIPDPDQNYHYLGYTWGKKGDWIRYQSSPEKSFVLENFIELQNDQEIKILLKPDFTDTDYKGPGEYLVRLKRYTASGSPSDYSTNTLTVNLNYTAPTPTPESTPTPTPSPTEVTTPVPTSTPTSTATPTPTPIKTLAPTAAKTPTISKIITSPTVILAQAGIHPDRVSSSPSSILGISTPSASPEIVIVRSDSDAAISDVKSSPNPSVLKYTFIFGALLSAGSGGWLYFRHRNG